MIDNSIKEELMIKGIPSSAGIVIGPVFVYQVDTSYEFCEVTAKDFSNEVKKLNNAVKRVLAELKRIKKETKKSYGPKLADLFNLQIGLLEDRYLIEEIEKKIKDENLCASYSVFQVMQSKKKHFLTLDNEYFKDRASEMQDLKRKLINIIEDRDQIILQDKPAVIIAKDISPSDTMKMYQKNVLAFVTETGGINSHAAIMGRALDIPSVVGSQGIMTRIKNGDMVIVDGIKGEVIINPSDSTVEIYRKEEESYHQFEKRMLKTKMSKTFTKDKIRVNILANIEFTKELGIIKKYKADGIGLYRTESLFMNRDALASEEEQVKNYLEMAEAMKNLPVTIRTLDVGGDKILPDIYKTAELNPFLGWRAIRFCLDNEEIFLAQLRAILRSNKYGNLRLMIPMISSYEEIIQTKEMIEKAKNQLRNSKITFNDNLKLGIMIEIPSAVLMGDVLAEEVDFFSIGTNDLTQYGLAVDRGNQKIANLYSPFHPAIIRLIKEVITIGKRQNIEVEMCGEMAGDPLAAPLLLGLGLRNFSMGHGIIPEIKQIIHELTINETEKLVGDVLRLKTTEEIENYLKVFFNTKYPQFVFS